ncbi:CAP domain-containing protein [Jutongia sp.]
MKMKNGKRIIASLLAAGLFAASVISPLQPEGAAAATKIKVSKTKVTVARGGQVTVKAKNTGSRKIKAKVSGKKVIAVKVMKKKIRITGKKCGKAKISLKAAHMKKCVIRITVKNMGQNDPTIIIPTGSSTPMVKVSASPAVSPAVRVTLRPSATPVRSPQSSVKPSGVPEPTDTSAEPSETNDPQGSIEPKESSQPDQTPAPTMDPQPPVTSVPTEKPQPGVTPDPAETPIPNPTPQPSATPSPTITPQPSQTPMPTQTSQPTVTPDPTTAPGPGETEIPFPTVAPTRQPTIIVTHPPTATPTVKPTAAVGTADAPTETPTVTVKPTTAPTVRPTTAPTAVPTATVKPTTTPTVKPTTKPTAVPTATVKPTVTPTTAPTATPVATMKTTQLSFAKKSLYIGESITALKAEWGEPERIDPLPQKNLYGYIYNGNSLTEPYLIAGVKGEKVVSYFTIAKNFTAYDAVIRTNDNETLQQTKLVQQGVSAQSMVDAGWSEPGTYEFDALDSSQGEARVGTEAYYKLTDNAYIYAFSDYFDEGDKSIYGMYAFSRECTKYSMMYRTYMTFNDEILRAAEQEVYEITNAYRNYMGKAFFTLEDRTTTAARKHSEDMANNNYFQHNSLDGSKFSVRLTAEGIKWSGVGENICAGAGDAINMVIGWIGSSGHRKGMLTDFKYIGVGAAYNSSADYGIYCTQDFWR